MCGVVREEMGALGAAAQASRDGSITVLYIERELKEASVFAVVEWSERSHTHIARLARTQVRFRSKTLEKTAVAPEIVRFSREMRE